MYKRSFLKVASVFSEKFPHDQTKAHIPRTTVPTNRSPGAAMAVVAPELDPPEAVEIVAFTKLGPQS